MDKIQRIKDLIQQLNKASDKYCNTSSAIMTDKKWDQLFDELKELESETGFIMNNSPTQNVGYEVLNSLEKVTHNKPMLSLDKTKSIDDLKAFLGNKNGVLSWKEDGLTIVLHYKNGKLIDAVTRGNGSIGSRIFNNAKVFKNIPQNISYKGDLVIRGEGLISKEDFDIININGEYANPRNLTSGSIMLLDSKEASKRHLQFKAFGIVDCDKEFTKYSEQLHWLNEQGFDVVEYDFIRRDTLEESILNFKNKIDNYTFATDGLVLMFDDLKYGDSLGSTSHHYNNAIAFKWSDTIVETQLLDIEFQTSRTGLINPVAKFQKVEIEGSMVEKATLHNLSILKSLELGIGDTLTVYKSNMIIPKIDDNLTRSNTFTIPTKCPTCNGDTEIRKSDSAEFLYCTNPNCKGKLVQKISHYVSRDAMNIMGLSEATIEKFIDLDILNSVADIYGLEQYKSKIVSMDGFGTKSYNNLIKSINISKQCELQNFIFALGIPNVGKGTAKRLVEYVKDDNQVDKLLKIKDMTVSDLMRINDIGDVVANSIVEFFKDKNNIVLLIKLIDEITFNEDKKVVQITNNDNILFGKHVYPTGTFALKKAELKIKLEEIGAIVESGYKKSLDYLICGGDMSKSGKADKAIKDNVKIMSEDELIELIHGGKDGK